MATTDGKVQVNVVFSETIYDLLEGMARREGKSKSDILRDAIGLKKWYGEVREKGGHVLVERDGKVREVSFD